MLNAIRPVDPESPFVLARSVEVLAGEHKKDGAIDTLLHIWFAGKEESPWPADYAWKAAENARLGDGLPKRKQIARTTGFVVRVFSLTIILALSYSSAVSKLRRPFLSNRYFFVTVRLLERRGKLTETDFTLVARAFNRARALHEFYLTAWVFLPDHWHAICAPLYPLSISLAVKSVKQSSTTAINRGRDADGELWQPRFFDRALRTVQETLRVCATCQCDCGG